MFPKRHLRENRSLIFRLLFQTTKNPEVSNVFSVCGSFQPLPKNCGPFLKFWDFCSVAVEPRYFAVGAYAFTPSLKPEDSKRRYYKMQLLADGTG